MTPFESSPEEVAQLRSCLNNLMVLISLHGLWSGGEPSQIVSALLETLLQMLGLSFVSVRLNDSDGEPGVEMVRIADPLDGTVRATAVSAAIDSLGNDPLLWPLQSQLMLGRIDLHVATARLGLSGEVGVIVAGSRRSDFPTSTERLLLDVAAKQSAISLQQAHLLSEQKRLARELDDRVARRTAELAAANALLLKEVAERRRTEEALTDRERETRLIVDSIPALVATLTPAGEVESVNKQVLAYCGRSLEELRQWATDDTVHPDDRGYAIDGITEALRSGTPYDVVERIRRFDGVYRWFQVRGLPLRNSNGQIVRWYVQLTDIDEAKRAEEALRKSEREFRLLVETIPALVWRGTPEGDLDYLNQRAVQYLGHTAQDLAGGRWLELVHPNQRETTVQRWLQSATTGTSYDDVYQLRRADGAYRWIRSVGEPLRDAEGRIVHWYGLVVDIEARKRAEDELRRSEAFLSQGQRLSSIGTFSWRLDTNEITLSQELRRIYETDTQTTPTLDRLLSLVHPEDRPMVVDKIERIRADLHPFEHELRLQMADGRIKHLLSFGEVICHPDGRLEAIGSTQDVTQRRVADEALNKVRSQLAHVTSVMSLGALTASIAHEVNQPLSGIITNAGTCLRMLDADPPNLDGARETARRAIRDGNRASDVITRLRALFSRKDFTPEPLDLNEVTREVVALLLSDLQRNKVVLQTEFEERLRTVTGDRIQLQQVLMNLLRNSADAMADVHDRPRQLLVRTERESGDHVRVTVKDAGKGLDPEAIDKLFDAFYTTKVGGMGVGLSVSRSIVERHHGRLWAEANDGPGATFCVSLPCSEKA